MHFLTSRFPGVEEHIIYDSNGALLRIAADIAVMRPTSAPGLNRAPRRRARSVGLEDASSKPATLIDDGGKPSCDHGSPACTNRRVPHPLHEWPPVLSSQLWDTCMPWLLLPLPMPCTQWRSICWACLGLLLLGLGSHGVGAQAPEFGGTPPDSGPPSPSPAPPAPALVSKSSFQYGDYDYNLYQAPALVSYSTASALCK